MKIRLWAIIFMEVLREMKINDYNLEERKESEVEEAGVQVAD